MNDNVKKLIDSAGVVAELYKVMFESFTKAGFNVSQALDLTKHQIGTQLMIQAQKDMHDKSYE
jgi:hypothetical protein